MGKNIVTLILLAAVSVLVGVGIVSKQATEPILKEIVLNQHKLDARLIAFDSQWKEFYSAFKQADDAQRRAQQQGPPQEDLNKVHQIDTTNAPTLGKKDAPITIVEFIDFQCPFCGRFHPAFSDAVKAYPDQVKLVLKNFPLGFHPLARPGAKAAMAAGEQGKYWDMADKIFKNQQSLSDDNFKAWAKEIGLNVDKFLKDLKEKDADYEKIINADMELGQKVDVRGTPTFYINGRKTTARDLDGVKHEIENILKGGVALNPVP